MPGSGSKASPGSRISGYRLGSESEISALYVGTYWFAVTGLTRSQPQPSARFPWLDHQSRNHSSPIELSVEPSRSLHPTVHVQRQQAKSDSTAPPGPADVTLRADETTVRSDMGFLRGVAGSRSAPRGRFRRKIEAWRKEKSQK